MLKDFWHYFASVAPKLGRREPTLQMLFEYLDKLADPLLIVETGSLREPGNWAGDGQSTLLFDRYAQGRPGSRVITVDNDPVAASHCRHLCSPRVEVHCEDSIRFLHRMAQQARPQASRCFYLDAFDVDWANPQPSAAHHLKELVAIAPLLDADSLVVVDDSPREIQGKGYLIQEYAEAIGAQILFHDYQLGITGWHPVPPAAGT